MKYISLLFLCTIIVPIFVWSQKFPERLFNHSFDDIFSINQNQVKKTYNTEKYIPSDTEKSYFKYFNISERINIDSVLFFSGHYIDKGYICYNDCQKVSLVLLVLKTPNDGVDELLLGTLGKPSSILESLLDKKLGDSYFWNSFSYTLQFLRNYYLGKDVVLLSNKKPNEYINTLLNDND
jgi:hypothetical protein